MGLERARGLGETWLLARAAGARAGVTRLADIGGLAELGTPVFQAVRPFARSLTVAQGKGASPLAAKVSALLEAAEMACGEALPRPAHEAPLTRLSPEAQSLWAGGGRAPLTIDLDPSLPRRWVDGRVLGSGQPIPMPWDLLSLDFTCRPLEFSATSAGLATGNTRDEALLAALAELIEHDLMARFEGLPPQRRRALQIDVASITDPALVREIGRVSATGFVPRLWSLGQHHDIAAIACTLFAPEPMLDDIAPAAGTACHPHAPAAALSALREAVQGRAALVAGARDDILPAHYEGGRGRASALAFATLAFGEGDLDWSSVPTHHPASTRCGVELLRDRIAKLTPLPVAVFDHPPPAPGLHVVHALAPGLRHLSRRRQSSPQACCNKPRSVSPVLPRRGRAVLFAGPSISGLTLPPEIELRPPAICGDMLALLCDPPAAVGLIDGHFGTAPSVWHKEILDLLARGVRVLGAASIGALRATELAEAGMEGVGAIHAAYRAGAIERDDAVMLLQAPAEYGFAPLSLALVDAEYSLSAVSCAPSARRMMQRIVRTMPYETRNWPRCLAEYRRRTGADFPAGLSELTEMPSLKQLDAGLLVDRLLEAAHDPSPPARSRPPPLTGYYLRLQARIPPVGVQDRS